MTHAQVTLVIGGCRSGKSSYALNEANQIAGGAKGAEQPGYFIATSVPTDQEMEDRVVKHQRERGPEWTTIEEPVQIDKAIMDLSLNARVILVDCLTLWTANLMFELKDQDRIEAAVQGMENALLTVPCPVFLVSNEVGYGIVPENQLARQFRDLAGSVNQRMARAADRVVQVVAGIDVQIKPR